MGKLKVINTFVFCTSTFFDELLVSSYFFAYIAIYINKCREFFAVKYLYQSTLAVNEESLLQA